MCLNINLPSTCKPLPKVSDKDIVCFKMLLLKNGDYYLTGTHFLTPWRWLEVPSECVEGKKDFTPLDAETDIYYSDLQNTWKVAGGAIHTYVDKYDTERHSRGVLFECVIPAGTPYYEGIDSHGHRGYASRKIRFVKSANNEEIFVKEELCAWNLLADLK